MRIGLGLAVLLLACGPDPGADRDVRMDVYQVGRDELNRPVVLLRERGGPRWLPIWVGPAEAQSIRHELDGAALPRPNSHDFAKRLVRGLQGEVTRVVVSELRAGTYYAWLTLVRDGERIEIDSRPSDAIALALRTGAPIFVRESLLDVEEVSREGGRAI